MRIIADSSACAVHKYLIFILIFVTTGCAIHSPTPISSQEPNFVAQGKIAFRAPENNHTANFRWSNFDDNYVVDVWGPLGQGRSQLIGDTAQMKITRGGEVLAEGAPEDIMRAYLGWIMPIDLLPGWLTGSDVDEENSVQEVSGWQVSFSRFVPLEGSEPASDQVKRPGRVEARRGEHRIIVSIREFSQ